MSQQSTTGQADLRVLKLALVGLVVVLVALLHHFGVLQRFQDPVGLTRALRGLGMWGYLVFIVGYALLQPFGVPGTVFVFAAPLIWPWPIAFGLSMAGTMAASVVGFSFARFVARDWVSGMIPERFRKYDRALATRAFTTVFLLRFVFWMPQLLHTFLGVSKVPFWTHFWASLAGYVLPLWLVSFVGQQLFNALKGVPAGTWLTVGIALAVVMLAAWARQKRHRVQPGDGT